MHRSWVRVPPEMRRSHDSAYFFLLLMCGHYYYHAAPQRAKAHHSFVINDSTLRSPVVIQTHCPSDSPPKKRNQPERAPFSLRGCYRRCTVFLFLQACGGIREVTLPETGLAQPAAELSAAATVAGRQFARPFRSKTRTFCSWCDHSTWPTSRRYTYLLFQRKYEGGIVRYLRQQVCPHPPRPSIGRRCQSQYAAGEPSWRGPLVTARGALRGGRTGTCLGSGTTFVGTRMMPHRRRALQPEQRTSAFISLADVSQPLPSTRRHPFPSVPFVLLPLFPPRSPVGDFTSPLCCAVP